MVVMCGIWIICIVGCMGLNQQCGICLGNQYGVQYVVDVFVVGQDFFYKDDE